jgi:hypothetical protein
MSKSKTVQAVYDQINSSVSSIFTKDDILKLVNEMHYGVDREIETAVAAAPKTSIVINTPALTDLIDSHISRQLDRMNSEDVIDYDSAEFSIDYNRTLQLDLVVLNNDNIVEYVTDGMYEVIDNYIESITPKSDILELNPGMEAAVEAQS